MTIALYLQQDEALLRGMMNYYGYALQRALSIYSSHPELECERPNFEKTRHFLVMEIFLRFEMNEEALEYFKANQLEDKLRSVTTSSFGLKRFNEEDLISLINSDEEKGDDYFYALYMSLRNLNKGCAIANALRADSFTAGEKNISWTGAVAKREKDEKEIYAEIICGMCNPTFANEFQGSLQPFRDVAGLDYTAPANSFVYDKLISEVAQMGMKKISL